MKTLTKALLLASIGSLAHRDASALSYNAASDGLVVPAGSLFISSGGGLQLKTVAGWTGLGVAGGAAGAEIDIGQKINISFTAGPQLFSSLTLGFLFDGPEFNDLKEIAAVRINGTTEYKLTATGATSATWSGLGAVSNLSPADIDGAGVWSISNPFGSMAITSLELYPLSSNPTGNESDFSLVGYKTTSVPDGGATFGLLGMAMTGLAMFRRKLRS
jgi:hypothetical protein